MKRPQAWEAAAAHLPESCASAAALATAGAFVGQLVDDTGAPITGARFAAVLAGQEAAAAPLYVRTNLELFTRTHEQFKRAAAAAPGGGSSSGRLFTTLISQARCRLF